MMQMTKQQNWRWTLISPLLSLFVQLQKRASWRVMEISWIPFVDNFLFYFSLQNESVWSMSWIRRI